MSEDKLKPVDTYWQHVLSIKTAFGIQKYCNLALVVTNPLCLRHGNTDVERSLSTNRMTLTPERTKLYKESVNGFRLVKDDVRVADGPCKVIITPSMLKATPHASAKYRNLKEEKEKEAKAVAASKEEEEKKKLKWPNIKMQRKWILQKNPNLWMTRWRNHRQIFILLRSYCMKPIKRWQKP